MRFELRSLMASVTDVLGGHIGAAVLGNVSVVLSGLGVYRVMHG